MDNFIVSAPAVHAKLKPCLHLTLVSDDKCLTNANAVICAKWKSEIDCNSVKLGLYGNWFVKPLELYGHFTMSCYYICIYGHQCGMQSTATFFTHFCGHCEVFIGVKALKQKP